VYQPYFELIDMNGVESVVVSKEFWNPFPSISLFFVEGRVFLSHLEEARHRKCDLEETIHNTVKYGVHVIFFHPHLLVFAKNLYCSQLSITSQSIVNTQLCFP
jgi:hypothetical protein